MRISKLSIQICWLVSYALFAYLYWIQRTGLEALLFLFALIVACYFLKSFREHLKFLSLLGVTHLMLWLSGQSVFFKWPLDFYIATLAGFVFLKYVLKEKRPLFRWGGSFTKAQVLSIFVINIPACLILCWYFNAHREVAQSWPIPEMSVLALLLVVVSIAVVNGLREEIYFRGLLQENSSGAFPSWMVILIQGLFFGFMHFANAFPQGWLGVFLTGMWGVAIAVQYQIFRSLKLAWLTHSIADAVMFSIILLTR